jgi:hypothetical protein
MKSAPRIEFRLPTGIVPEGTAVGEDFDLVVTLRLKAGGSVCMVQAGDVKLPGYEAKERGSKPSYKGEYDQMQAAGGMANGTGTGGPLG